MFVKVCGVTRLEDAEAAVAAGANALGFVFWQGSPRYIDPFRARRIVDTFPPFVTAVGLFVNQPLEVVTGVAALARLGAVQLHGDETPAFAARVRRPVIKAIAVDAESSDGLRHWPAAVTMLLDAHDPVKRGGTGRTIDWAQAATVARSRRVLLAGGLRPENVGDAIRAVRPFGIDVSSGIETSPGIKDHGRILELFAAVDEASRGLLERETLR